MPFTLKEHKTLFKLQLGPGKLLCPHSVPLTWMMFPTHKDFSIWIHLQIWPSRHNLSLCQENKSTLKKGNFIHFGSEFPPGLCSLWKERGYELPRAMGVLGSAEEPSARAPLLSGPTTTLLSEEPCCLFCILLHVKATFLHPPSIHLREYTHPHMHMACIHHPWQWGGWDYSPCTRGHWQC